MCGKNKVTISIIDQDDHINFNLTEGAFETDVHWVDNGRLAFDQIFIPDRTDQDRNRMVADKDGEADQDRFFHHFRNVKATVLLGFKAHRLLGGFLGNGYLFDPQLRRIRMHSRIFMILPNAQGVLT